MEIRIVMIGQYGMLRNIVSPGIEKTVLSLSQSQKNVQNYPVFSETLQPAVKFGWEV
jgi:hypothetical protein